MYNTRIFQIQYEMDDRAMHIFIIKSLNTAALIYSP